MPAVVFTMRNEFGDVLVEERRAFPPEITPKIAFPGVTLFQNEPYLNALSRGIRYALGVQLVNAGQIYPQHFIQTEVTRPLWYQDIEGERWSVFPFMVGAWLGEIGSERRDTHAKLRWVSLVDAESDGLPYTQVLAELFRKLS